MTPTMGEQRKPGMKLRRKWPVQKTVSLKGYFVVDLKKKMKSVRNSNVNIELGKRLTGTVAEFIWSVL